MMNQEVINFLKTALECSVLISPLDPGLTAAELAEIGNRAGYQNGEINDALRFVTTRYFGASRLLPSEQDTASWVFFFPEEPDYRNFDAFDFVVEQLNTLTRAEGAANAAIQRDVLVERAIARGIARQDVDVAVTWQLMSKQLTRKTELSASLILESAMCRASNYGPIATCIKSLIASAPIQSSKT